MLSPIGSFIVRMDTALTGSMDGIIGAMVAYMATPIALCAILYYIMQGFRFANGDGAVASGFVPQLIRVAIIMWLSSNLDAFNFWVRDLFFTGLPAALSGVITYSTTDYAGSASATAAIFDNVYNQVLVIVGTAWMQVGLSVTGVLMGIGGLLTLAFGGASLLVIALIYVGTRFLLAVVVCLMPVLIGCAMFEATKGFFERGVGKIVSLLILQIAGYIVLQIVMLGNQWFMAQATTSIITALNDRAVLAEALQVLVALVIWFVGGAYTMWQARSVAYSIGGGIMVGGPSAYATIALMRSLGGGSGGTAPARDASYNDGPPPNLSLSLNRDALGGPPAPATAALPPPPPPRLNDRS